MTANSIKRATYSPGRGLLFANGDRLLFVAVAEHAAVPALLSAIQGDGALDSLATAVASAGFEVPPFVFIQQDKDLQGMVVGAINVVLADPEISLLRGDADDSGRRFRASNSTVVSVGEDAPMSMWVEVGFVYAGAFRWAAAETAAPKMAPSSATAGDVRNDAAAAATAAALSDLDGDPTIEAPQPFAASVVPVAEPGPGRSGHRDAEPTTSPATDDHVEESQPRDTVDARICFECGEPNPPEETRCRACGAPIADGETRAIVQPTLGILHLSGGRFEPLDMDLLIGRNPAREPLEPNQRAVIHGQGDRSVSRRHIDVRLDGWRVVVSNLKDDDHTIVERSDGTETPLAPGVSRTLEVGDTVRYGGSWFRYEQGP